MALGFEVGWVDAEGSLVLGDGTGGVLHALHDLAGELVGEWGVGADGLDLGEGGLGLLELELAEEIPAFLVLGVTLDELLELGDGVFAALEADVGAGEGEPGEVVIGQGGDAGFKRRHGLGGVAELQVAGAEHDAGGGHVRLQAETLFEGGDGLGEAIEVEEQAAEVVVGGSDGGVEAEKLVVIGDGLLGVAGFLIGVSFPVELLNLGRLCVGQRRRGGCDQKRQQRERFAHRVPAV